MKLQFEANQDHQSEAVAAVVDAFDGAPPDSSRVLVDEMSLFATVANHLLLDEEALLANIRMIQDRNGLAADPELRLITELVPMRDGEAEWSFANLSVEMETGTGKTYVYVRTALELFRRHGLRKFIVVVPSIAIRSGTLKTLQVTRDHFAVEFGDIPYAFYEYDSAAPGLVRQFALSNSVEFMIMTLDSFNKASNLIHRPADSLQGDSPVELLQGTRPVLILDEPQNMGTTLATKALATLMPTVALRYSATHRDPFSLLYRLTPLEAYRRGLVKQIEVAGVEKDSDANTPYMELLSINATARTPSARMKVHVLRAGGGVREKPTQVKSGTGLTEATDGRPEYAGFVVDEINPTSGVVRFTNNVQLSVGETRGDNRAELFDSQIRYTIREHLLKQERLRQHGIKVLSLFFIDHVANYQGEGALIRRLFDEAFEELKLGLPDWERRQPADVQRAYFAQKTRRSGAVELLDTKTGQSAEDREAFELIMHEKERLLSFEEPVAFIFSHSALREGWDNPNVAQICTLNQTLSEVRKRQEIGRGMRLMVNQDGERVLAPELNVLTVVANSSYEQFVDQYQREIQEDFDSADAGTQIRNAREKRVAQLKRDVLEQRDFGALWSEIRTRTRFAVRVDTEKLLSDVVPKLDGAGVRPVRIRVAKGQVTATEDGFSTRTVAGSRTVATSNAEASVADVVDTMGHLLEHGNPPMRLTRRTLLQLFLRSETKQVALANPHGWATAAVRLLREHLADQFVENIKYEPDANAYDVSQFDPTVESWGDRMVDVARSVYDRVAVDSDIERTFVKKLDTDERTKCFVKLPRWFTVDTPIGTYNPDWAIVRELRDEHGAVETTLHLVAETKGTLELTSLRPPERRKIECGKAHFGSLNVRFDVLRTVDDLDSLDDPAIAHG